MDPRQRQRLGWIVRFFALLLVLTLLARGTAGAAMASVTVQRPSSGNVTKSVRTTATVSFAGGTPFIGGESMVTNNVNLLDFS